MNNLHQSEIARMGRSGSLWELNDMTDASPLRFGARIVLIQEPRGNVPFKPTSQPLFDNHDKLIPLYMYESHLG